MAKKKEKEPKTTPNPYAAPKTKTEFDKMWQKILKEREKEEKKEEKKAVPDEKDGSKK